MHPNEAVLITTLSTGALGATKQLTMLHRKAEGLSPAHLDALETQVARQITLLRS